MFSSDLVFLRAAQSTSRLFGCFSRKVELVLPLWRPRTAGPELIT